MASQTKRKRQMQSDEGNDTDSVSSTGQETSKRKKWVSPLNRRRSVRLAQKQENMETQDSPNPALLSRQSTTHNIRQMLGKTKIKEDKPSLKKMQTSQKWTGWRKKASVTKQDTTMPPKLQKMDTKPPPLKKKASKRSTVNGAGDGGLPTIEEETGKSNRNLKRKAESESVEPKQRKAVKRQLTDDTATKAKKLKTSQSLKRERKESISEGKADVYIPPQKDWPVTIDAQVPWFVPLEGLEASVVLVDECNCLIGTKCGELLELDEAVMPKKVDQFPTAVRSLVKDADILYVGCEDSVYDHAASHLLIKSVYTVSGKGKLMEMAACNGKIVAVEDTGRVTYMKKNGEQIWENEDMFIIPTAVEMDDTGVYVAYVNSVIKLSSKDGSIVWRNNYFENAPYNIKLAKGRKHIYVGVGSAVFKLNNATGQQENSYEKGKDLLEKIDSLDVCGDCVYVAGNKLLVYDQKSSEIVYDINLGFSCTNMQYFSGRVFCAGEETMTVVDLTKKSVEIAQCGGCIETTRVSADPAEPSHVVVKPACDGASKGVMVECVKPKNRKGKIIVRTLSSGWNKNWEVDLPEDLKVAGAKFLVENLEEKEDKRYSIIGNVTKVD